MIYKKRLIVYVIVGGMMMLFLLTGCAQESSVNRRIYQPSTLRPIAGQVIQTHDGFYVTGTDEVWHSDIRYRDLENAYLNSTAK